jgi:hypothetical protein
LGVDNPSVTSGNADTQHFNPGESWTVKFNVPIIFREIDAVSIGGSDIMRVAFNSSTFDFGDSDFNSSDNKTDPFGSLALIPANTNITFTNTTSAPFNPYDTSATSTNVWRLVSFTVEQVPEPSSIGMIGIASVGAVSVAFRRRRKGS